MTLSIKKNEKSITIHNSPISYGQKAMMIILINQTQKQLMAFNQECQKHNVSHHVRMKKCLHL